MGDKHHKVESMTPTGALYHSDRSLVRHYKAAFLATIESRGRRSKQQLL